MKKLLLFIIVCLIAWACTKINSDTLPVTSFKIGKDKTFAYKLDTLISTYNFGDYKG